MQRLQKQDAAGRGAWMHLQFELYFNRMPSILDNAEGRRLRTFLSTMRGCAAFRTEWTIFDEKRRLAGSIDLVVQRYDGSIVLIDWKRTRDLPQKYDGYGKMLGGLSHLPDAQGYHYRLQLNVYRFILEENYGYTVHQMLVVCCHPDLETPFIDDVPRMHEEVLTMMNDQERRVSDEPGLRTRHETIATQPPVRTEVVHVLIPQMSRARW